MEGDDLFWTEILERRAEWLQGKEESKIQWYLGWKSQSELSVDNPKHAYQWGLSTVQSFPDYTRMYEVLAKSAERFAKILDHFGPSI